jgi:hypothetical protein
LRVARDYLFKCPLPVARIDQTVFPLQDSRSVSVNGLPQGGTGFASRPTPAKRRQCPRCWLRNRLVHPPCHPLTGIEHQRRTLRNLNEVAVGVANEQLAATETGERPNNPIAGNVTVIFPVSCFETLAGMKIIELERSTSYLDPRTGHSSRRHDQAAPQPRS